MARLVIVSNRVTLPGAQAARAGGLAVALREATRKHSALWFGWSGETAATLPEAPTVAQSGRTSFATVDLTEEAYQNYYLGFANRVLWPLFHYRISLIDFRRDTLKTYLDVNDWMASQLAPLLRPDDLIWVHDYQLIPFGAALRRRGVRNRIGFFLHIPFPAAEVLSVIPNHRQLVESLFAYDLIGLQTHSDLLSLRDYVVRRSDGSVEGRTLKAFGRDVLAEIFPIGIETDAFEQASRQAAHSHEVECLHSSLGGRRLIIGVDRLDYSKGLPVRFEAYNQLLTEHPDYRNKVVMMQIAPTSRTDVKEYRAIRRELESVAGRINGRYAEFDWVPIRYLNRSFTRNTLAGFYRMAKVGLVTPYRDGMNLVAKEYVAAQNGEDPGVLVLSEFAGAASELKSALLINPNDVVGVGEALHRALTMPLEERKSRWQAMIHVLRRNSVHDWLRNFVDALRG